MALEKYEYPSSGPVTASWLPTENTTWAGAPKEIHDGIIADQSAGKQEYQYEEGLRVTIWRRQYILVSNTATSDFQTFRNTVAGDKFKFTDYDGTAHTVSFVPGSIRYTPENDIPEWTFEFEMREEI